MSNDATSSKSIINNVGRELRDDVKDNLKERRGDIKNLRVNLKNASSSPERLRLWNDFKELRLEKRADFKTEIETKRIELHDLLEVSRRQEAENLNKIRDEKKRNTVEELNVRLNGINTKRLDYFTEILGKLDNILEKIVGKADELSAAGKDVSSLRLSITDAATLIESAKVTLTLQAGKVYTILIASDGALKNNFGKTRSALAHDLQAVFDSVKSAREGVLKAAQALRVASGLGAAISIPVSTTTPTFTLTPMPTSTSTATTT